MSLLNSTDTDGEVPQNCERDLPSLVRQKIVIDENKKVALIRVIGEIAKKKGTDNLPDQIVEAAEAVLKTSSGINWLQNHKEDFERIIDRASILVIGLGQSYEKSKKHSPVWPTPKLRIVVENLIEIVHSIHRFMKRQFKNLAKRIFKGYVVRDIGKLKRYEQKLDSVAEDLEKLGDIKVNEVLLEVLDNKAQHHDDAELSDDKENTQRRADTLELLAGGSNGQRKTSAAKPTYRKMKSVKENEVDQTRSKALEEIKNNVINVSDHDSEDDDELPEEPARSDSLHKENTRRRTDSQGLLAMDSNSRREAGAAIKPTYRISEEDENEVDQLKSMALERITNNNNDSEVQHFKGPHRSDSKEKKKMITVDKNVQKWTSEQGFGTNRAGPTEARKGLNQISDYELSTDNEDVPVSLITMSPTEEKKPAMTPKHLENVRSQTAPPQLPMSTSGVSIANYGPGNVDSRDVGNIKDSTISNVGNNNSKNYIQPRPKPKYAKNGKTIPRQNLRRETAPSQFTWSPPGVSIINHGSGTVTTSDVGNIKNSSISNAGNNNSENHFQARPKPTYPGDGH